MDTNSWTITGAQGEAIIGNTHTPEDAPKATAIIVHGFMGYKDYGFFPTIADRLARAGVVAHRFNLSHSGVTENYEQFERPDLFAKNTWNRQVEDIECVRAAMERGELVGAGLPMFLVGHSRGAVASLLFTGQRAARGEPGPVGVVTIASPDRCNSLNADQEKMLRAEGYLEVTSARTGQTLRIDESFWEEQRDDPESHDVLGLVARIQCPLMVMHGSDDPTVNPSAAEAIVGAAPNARLVMISGANHVLNTPNPFDPAEEPPAPLAQALEQMLRFIEAGTSCR